MDLKLKKSCDENTIHNLESLTTNEENLLQNELLDISSLSNKEIRNYLQTLFYQRGDIFASSSGNYIIVLNLDSQSFAKTIQMSLRNFQINSIIINDDETNSVNLLISKKKSLKNFKEKISSEFVNGSEIVDHYIFKIDWED